MYWEKVRGDLSITSYVVPSAKGKRNVLCLSTLRPLLAVTVDDGKRKPAVLKLYDFTKGGTDIVDQRIGKYSTKSKSPKWTRVCLSYILDTVRVNASTVLLQKLGMAEGDVDSFELGWNLAEALVLPFAKQRSVIGLSKKTAMKLSLLLGDSQPPTQPAHSCSSTSNEVSPGTPKRKRCHICISELAGPGYKAEKDKLPKVKSTCCKCRQTACGKHLQQTCRVCA